jgi:hypothetical protein
MSSIILALAAMLQPAPAAPDLSWLAGYWLSCADGNEVSETWSDERGGTMAGTTLTTRGGETSFEFARIGLSPTGLSFFAQPGGGEPTQFVLAEAGPSHAIFANPAHDFPQRVIYRRDGERLAARIEGVMNGQPAAIDWSYRAAPLNTRCAG